MAKIDFTEIGVSGLKQHGGYIDEEFLPQLKGKRALRAYRQMADNDPVIGGILFAIEMLIRRVDWSVEPISEAPEDEAVAEFVFEAMHDMEMTWADFIAEVLTMLPAGFAPMEPCFKRRQGITQKDSTKKSQYTDGRIGWRKIALRSQETIERWDFDNDLMIQVDPETGETIEIPMEKILLFRTRSNKGNPEGRSILRNAYKPWYYKSKIEEIEAIGIERDLAGLPVAYVPPEILDADADANTKAGLAAIKEIVINIRRDEQEGLVFPLVYDDKGNQLYKLELLSSGGNRQFDTSEIISRYDKRIAMTVLADFIMLGQDKVGSFALSSDKTKLFATALGAWLKSIEELLNREAVPKLLELNGIPLDRAPKITAGDIEKQDIIEFADSVSKLVSSGALLPSEELSQKSEDMLEINSNG